MSQPDTLDSADTARDRSSARSSFRPDIEGLRAVAVLAVVGVHAGVPGLAGGYVGVDVFFVISGFLITGVLWREAASSGTVRLRKFYGARARRLLPASAAVGTITMIASARLLPPLQVPSVLADGVTSALYVGNYWFLARSVDYFANRQPPSPFLHYWSLGVEEQFYLLWPVLILVTAWLIAAVRRSSRASATASVRPYLIVLTVVAVGSLALSLAATLFAPAAAFFSLPTRAWQLAAGGLVALAVEWWRRRPPRIAVAAGWIGLVSIAASCVLFTAATPYPGAAALLPTVGTVLVIGAGCTIPAHGVGRLLGLAPMRAIGRISYSWYLWHWPVLLLVPALLGHPLGLLGRLAAVLFSAVLAVLTLRFVENPLRFADRLRTSPWRSIGLGGAVTAMAVAVGVVLVLTAPTQVGPGAPVAPVRITASSGQDAGQLFAEVQAAVAASGGTTVVPSNLVPALADVQGQLQAVQGTECFRSAIQSSQPECVSGDTASATTVAVIGDSQAAMWTPAFEQLAVERHWRLETFAKVACPMMHLDIANPFRRLVKTVEHCKQWSAEILDRLRAERPALVVLSVWRGYGTRETMTGFTSYDPVWLDGLANLVRELRAVGSQVLVLGGIPDPKTDTPICLSGHPRDVPTCGTDRSTAVNKGGIAAEQAAVEAVGGQYANLTNLFCTADRPENFCPVIVGNTMVYIDDHHVTIEYAKLVAPVLGALAERALNHEQ